MEYHAHRYNTLQYTTVQYHDSFKYLLFNREDSRYSTIWTTLRAIKRYLRRDHKAVVRWVIACKPNFSIWVWRRPAYFLFHGHVTASACHFWFVQRQILWELFGVTLLPWFYDEGGWFDRNSGWTETGKLEVGENTENTLLLNSSFLKIYETILSSRNIFVIFIKLLISGET